MNLKTIDQNLNYLEIYANIYLFSRKDTKKGMPVAALICILVVLYVLHKMLMRLQRNLLLSVVVVLIELQQFNL